MENKMGRPLKYKTNLSHEVKARLDDELFDQLTQYCKDTGKERATAIREGICLLLQEGHQKEVKNDQAGVARED